MRIFDISQELFTCAVWPTDPAPKKQMLSVISEGSVCNVTEFSMCAHNGTHVDAPYHFIDDGMTVDALPLYKTVGECYVTHYDGVIDAEKITEILKKAEEISSECARRILVGGRSTLSESAASVLAEKRIELYGNESQTVGPENAPMKTHLILLGAETVLLEGVRLCSVPEGKYILSAAPINLGGSDGSPCRAVLIEL
jgi:arylformamidase